MHKGDFHEFSRGQLSDVNGVSRNGVGELDFMRTKKQALAPVDSIRMLVLVISDHSMAECVGVFSDLMGPARVKLKSHQADGSCSRDFPSLDAFQVCVSSLSVNRKTDSHAPGYCAMQES